MSRLLNFSTENTLYLLLNIIAHDVIHDYGPSGGSEERWQKNQILVKQFTHDYLTFSNPLTSSATSSGGEAQASKKLKAIQIGNPDQDFEVATKINPDFLEDQNYARGTKFDYAQTDSFIIEYENYLNTLNEMKNQINNTLIFTCFNRFLLLLNQDSNLLDNINYINTENYIVPLGLEYYTDVCKDLSNKFIGFCLLHRYPKKMKYKIYLDELCKFLSMPDTTEQSIFENIDFGVSIKRKRQEGGKPPDIKLNHEEAQNLINEIDKLNNDEKIKTYLNELNYIYEKFKATEGEGAFTSEDKIKYQAIKQELLKEYKEVFNKQKQFKKSGSLDGEIFLPTINRFNRKSKDIDLIFSFNNKILSSQLDYYKIIKEYTDTEAIIAKKKLEDEMAADSGLLTSMDKDVRREFSKFIARSGLFLTGVCDTIGKIQNPDGSDFLNELDINSALRLQINILLYITGWERDEKWQTINNQSLDDELIKFFLAQSYETPTGICTGFYVVNNAAPLTTQLKNKSFCPYTSILDGMSQCSWKSAQGSIEYGNMDFKIFNNNNLYYNGKLIIADKVPPALYPTNLSVSFDVKLGDLISLTGEKNTTINGSDLEAHFVLKNTLVGVIDHILTIIKSDDKMRDAIFKNSIFENLFTLFSENLSTKHSTNDNFNIVYKEILFKGTGDLFQEINCVSKFGGYTMTNYQIDDGILSNNTSSGDQVRYFAANDRPSGTRFIYMLLHGQESDINIKAMGGYYSKEVQLIVKRYDNSNNCVIITGGKIRKKHKSIKIRKHKNTKKTQKHKNTKKTQKYKNTKKHKNTKKTQKHKNIKIRKKNKILN